MEGAPLHCSRRPRTRHGPWGPLIHHGCPRPRIYHGRLNSLPRFLKPNVLSLPLVSPFPLGPSLGQGSLLRPGGHLLHCGDLLSHLLRPGGRLSRLLRPGGRLSRLLRPGGRLSRLLRPGGRLSRLLRPGGRLSRLLRPGGRLSRLLRPGGRLSRLLRPGGPHVSVDLPESPHVSVDLPESPHVSVDLPESPPPTCQSRLRRPARVASADLPESPHVPAVSSALPWWAPVSLAPHGPGPPFPPPVPPPLHRPPGLCRVCEASGSRSLGGALSWIWLPLTTTAHHPWTTSPIMHCTLTLPSTITPITQLSPFTH